MNSLVDQSSKKLDVELAGTDHPVLRLLHQRRQRGDADALRVRTAAEFREWMVWQMFVCRDQEVFDAYDAHGLRQLGADPLGGGGAHQWPEELTGVPPGTGEVEAVEEGSPVSGWRYWATRGPDLVAPFRSADVVWLPGTNESEHASCGQSYAPHPSPVVRCLCGIRVMQSARALRRFVESTSGRNGKMATAFAEVALWGRVAGPAGGDDWRYTARGQYGRLVGPIYLHASRMDRASEIANRYGVEVLPAEDLPR